MKSSKWKRKVRFHEGNTGVKDSGSVLMGTRVLEQMTVELLKRKSKRGSNKLRKVHSGN